MARTWRPQRPRQATVHHPVGAEALADYPGGIPSCPQAPLQDRADLPRPIPRTPSRSLGAVL